MKNLFKTAMTFAIAIVTMMVINNVNATTSFAGGIDDVDITREVTKVTNPVSNTFTYTITADSSNPSGGVTGAPTTTTIVFDAVNPSSNKATATGKLDFSGASFTKRGDYKFTIAETSSSNSSIYPVDDTTYDVYVQVTNELDSEEVPTGNLIATVIPKDELKFTSEPILTNLSLSKKVKGNNADINEYFEFEITFTRATNGDKYKVTGQSKSGAATECTVGSTCTVYLKHGETVTVGKDGSLDQIPVGVSYTITEKGATDYETKVDGTDGKATPSKTTEESSANNKTEFVNKKTSAVVTGVMLTVIPFIILLVVAGVGIIIIKKLKTKETK